MLDIVLCDDDPAVLAQCRERLDLLAKKHDIALQLRGFASAEQLLFALEESPLQPDILYLDVQMGGQTGIEAAKRLRAAGCRAQIIFLTNAREYVFESFDAAPLQYLLKGELTDAKFAEVFLRAAKLAAQTPDELFEWMHGAQRQTLPLREIVYFEVRKRIITLHVAADAQDFYSSMEELEERLTPRGFVRTHRAYLVNVAHIRRLGQEELLLSTGETLPLGRTYSKGVRETLSRFLAAGGAL